MKTTKALLVVLPVASIVFASGCSSDSVVPVPTCFDGKKNQDETDKDCGGLICSKPCSGGSACQVNSDCLVGFCEAGACLGGDAPLNATQLCALYWAGIQNTQDSDDNVFIDGYSGMVCTQATIFDARKYDAAIISYYCRPGTIGYKWGQALITAVNDGRVAIDWGMAKSCLEQSRELRASKPGVLVVGSPEWLALKVGICKSFYEGTKAQGVACKEDWDCQGDMGCYTATPTIAGSRTCLPGAGLNGACSEWLPCAADFTCDHGHCVDKLGLGDDCYYASDCASGVCDQDKVCGEAPTTGVGESCTSAAECNLGCGSCRPTLREAPTTTTCQPLGLTGEFCRDWLDCALDLGCVDGVCTASPAGTPCGTEGLEIVCDAATVCIALAPCATYLDQASCEADAACVYDSDNEECAAIVLRCVAKADLPTSGACLGGVCGGQAVCTTDNRCVIPGRDGAVCDDVNPCDQYVGFTCTTSGRCALQCANNEDCPAGNFCADLNGDHDYECSPFVTTGCTGNFECAPSTWCRIAGKQCFQFATDLRCSGDSECHFTAGTCIPWDGTCAQKPTRDTCTTDPKCAWLPSGSCGAPDCYVDVGAAGANTACAAKTGCVWTAAAGSTPATCQPSCFTYTTTAACTADTKCSLLTIDGNTYCVTNCDLPANNDQTSCDGLAGQGCRWNFDFCRTTETCSQLSGNDAACMASGYCRVETPTSCDAVSSATTGACTAALATGTQCVPEDELDIKMASLSYFGEYRPDSSLPAASCVGGYSKNVPGTEEYVCSEPASAGCADNNALKQVIGTSFLFGSILFVRRRRRA
jgi:hypothetical protein